MKELKETDLNKRDTKAMYKNLNQASDQTEMNKEMVQIWLEVKSEYVKTLIRCPVEPKIWLEDCYPKSEHEVVHTLMIEGKFEVIKRYFETAKEMYNPNPVF